jgi:O-antigen ligase
MLGIIFVSVLILVLVIASINSEVHALGIWLLLIITHNLIVVLLGSSAEHLPLFAAAIISVVVVARKKWTGVSVNFFLLLVMIVIAMAAAAIAGIDPQGSLIDLIRYSKGMLLATLIAGLIKSDSQIRCLTQYAVIGISIGICVTLFEGFTGNSLIEEATTGTGRAGGFTGNPNRTAALLLAGIPLFLFWATHTKLVSNSITQYVMVGLAVGAIVFTESRGNFVALIFLLTIFFLRRPSIKAAIIGLVVFVAMLQFAPVDSDYWTRMGSIVELEDVTGSSIEKRKYYTQAGIQMTLENPLLGVGMGNFGKAMLAANPNLNEPENRVAHNMYLEFFSENGIPGGLLFCTLLGVAVLQAIKYDKQIETERPAYGLGFCVGMSLTSLLLTGLFSSSATNPILWFYIGLGFAFQEIVETARENPNSISG